MTERGQEGVIWMKQERQLEYAKNSLLVNGARVHKKLGD